jgi:hypothetical protein
MATPPTSQGSANAPGYTSGQWKIVAVVAIVILLAYFGFLAYMWTFTKSEEPQWTRSVYLLTGIEAIAFAAAGFLFGKEVHREQAQTAEKRAQSSEDRAVVAEKGMTEETTKGRDLVKAIEAKKEGHRSKGPHLRAIGVDQMHEATQADFEELANLAERLFP